MLRGLVHAVLWFLSKSMALMYTPILLYYRCVSSKKCPAITDEIYFAPATILAKKIRGREVSSTKVVTAYIDRVKEVNPILNAVVEDRFKDALEEAQYVDQFLQTCDLSVADLKTRYPLLGVPITIKESLKVRGMSNGAGVKHSEPPKALEDAECVKQLKTAGVIVILVSNTPEMCINWETFNYVTGRTLNPYDTRRTCGGSSGGEAALVACCGSVIGVGSDLVGSLRLPPAFCGVYGHRASPGFVSREGHCPDCNDDTELWNTACSFGPITRYASDLQVLLQIMLKPRKKRIARIFEEINVKEIRVFYMFHDETGFTSSINPEIKNAISKVVDHLQFNGFYTEKLVIDLMSDTIDITFLQLLRMNMGGVFDHGKSVVMELIRTMFFCPTVTPNSVFLVILKFAYGCLITQKRTERNEHLIKTLKQTLNDKLGPNGVLIYPAFTSTAHYHGQIYSKTLDSSYLGLWSILGFPVTVIPAGLSSEGLPIGLQVISIQNNDRLCLALARELERTLGGWIPPTYSKKIPISLNETV